MLVPSPAIEAGQRDGRYARSIRDGCVGTGSLLCNGRQREIRSGAQDLDEHVLHRVE